MFGLPLASATARHCNTNPEKADLYCWGQIKKHTKHTLISAVKTDRIESGSHCGERSLEPGVAFLQPPSCLKLQSMVSLAAVGNP